MLLRQYNLTEFIDNADNKTGKRETDKYGRYTDIVFSSLLLGSIKSGVIKL